MTRVQVIGTAVLSLLLGAPAVSQAQVGEPDLVADGRFQRGSRQGGERQGARREGRQGADRGTFSRGSSPRQGGEGRVRERQGGLTGRVRERAAEQPRTERRSGGDLSRPSRRPDSSRGSYTRPGSGLPTPSGGTYDRGGSTRGTYDRGGSTRGTYDRGSSTRGSYDRGSSTRGSYDGGRYDGSRSTTRRDYDRRDSDRRDYGGRDYDRSSSRYGGRGSFGDRSWLRYRARNFHSERRSWRQRGGYRGYRLPQSYFHSHFGRNRWFRGSSVQFVFINERPYFDYDDYRFTLLDPYPEYWGDDWYYEDDLYVDYYDDGYYLCNRRYPDRPGVAISIDLRF